jgi:curved DNA-binding protein CbpA
MPKVHTHYDNLKVARNAPIEVIAAAYRSLANKHHPDRNSGNSDATRIMAILNASYEALSDPEKRAVHDRWIRREESGTIEEKPPQRSAPPQRPAPHPPPNVVFKNFRLEADSFYWKEKLFLVSEIKHLFFKRVLTTQRMNFVKVGDHHSTTRFARGCLMAFGNPRAAPLTSLETLAP